MSPQYEKKKVCTGISGLDELLRGGLNECSINLISGGSGTGKTLFALSYIYNGAKNGIPGIFVTLEESRQNIIANALSTMSDIGKVGLEIIDVSALRRVSSIEEERAGISSIMDIDTMCDLICARVKERSAKRVSIDGIASLSLRYPTQPEFRSAVFRLASALRQMDVTAILTTEIDIPGRLSRLGVEEFVADSVIILSKDGNMRNLRVHKMRGEDHAKGEHRFSIGNELSVFPTRNPASRQISPSERVGSGIAGLDKMLGGGFFKGDSILLSGSSGTGKTIFSLQFASHVNGGKSIYVSLNETPSEIRAHARALGMDLEKLEREGKLEIVHCMPTEMIPSEHASMLHEKIKGASRIVIDSLTDYPNPDSKKMQDFFGSLISLFKSENVTSLSITDMPEIIGMMQMSPLGIVSLCDSVIMMRYVEVGSEMRRALNVFKMRGTGHDRSIVEYAIGKSGIELKKKFEGLEGILHGSAKRSAVGESLSVAKQLFG